ncbi:MAG: hypothetical protein C7B46_10075 [Sulfobacillus benefaciens]|uniref:Uncharacterized protein n=1 Tax=Sulfobacillus benefaciens TaxID=453960 RepID=A0A2T2XFV8_9FIRM|nr:MAG: hypothetical protein C7B46_10075 [Sulfobacillus benefaciens]
MTTSQGAVERKVARNISAMTLGRIGQSVMGIFATAYMVRVLGPHSFGMLSFAMAIVSYFSLISSLGIPTLASRTLSRNLDNASEIASQMITLLFAMGFCSFLLLLCSIPLLRLTSLQSVVLVISGLQLILGPGAITWAFASLQKMSTPAIVALVGTGVRVGIVFLLVHNADDVVWATWATVSGALVTSIGQIWFLHRMCPLRWQFSWISARKILWTSAPMALSLMMTKIYGNSDSVILGYMKGAVSVGYYNAAYRLIWFLTSITELYIQTVFPVSSRLYKSHRELLVPFIQHNLEIASAVAMPIVMGGWIIAPRIIHLIYGNNYIEAVEPFRILLLVWGLVVITQHYGNTLIACNGEKLFSKGVTYGAVFNVLANIVVIPRYGITGAASATFATEILVFLYMVWAVHTKLGWYGPGWHRAVFVVVNTAILGVFVNGLAPYVDLPILVLGSVTVYINLTLITKVVSWNQLKLLFTRR